MLLGLNSVDTPLHKFIHVNHHLQHITVSTYLTSVDAAWQGASLLWCRAGMPLGALCAGRACAPVSGGYGAYPAGRRHHRVRGRPSAGPDAVCLLGQVCAEEAEGKSPSDFVSNSNTLPWPNGKET